MAEKRQTNIHVDACRSKRVAVLLSGERTPALPPFGQDFADTTIQRGRADPLLRISKRDLLEPNTIAVRCGTDMEMPRHNDSRIEAQVPIVGSASSAPERETRYSWEFREILA